MWTYEIASGKLTSADGKTVLFGYSGAGHSLEDGRNNPAMQGARNQGPIPVGIYAIGEPHTSAQCGPYTMDLTPTPGTDTLGRSLFRIHGNNAANDASHGCIILPPNARRAVWESKDHILRVVVG